MFPGNQNQRQQWFEVLKAEVVAVTWNEQWYYYMVKEEIKSNSESCEILLSMDFAYTVYLL